MTPLQRFQAALQRDQDRLNARLNEDAELVRCFKAEDEANGIVWAIGSATALRPFGLSQLRCLRQSPLPLSQGNPHEH